MDHRSALLIAGIGSGHGDDQAGWLVVEQLTQMLGAVSKDERTETLGATAADVRRTLTPLDLLDWLEPVERLIICDAFEATAVDESPICIRRCGDVWIEATRGTTTERLARPSGVTGTHGMGVFDVLQLADAMGSLPSDVTIWGIAGKNFTPDCEVSAGCRSASKVVAEAIFESLCRGHLSTNALEGDHRSLRDFMAGRFHA